MKIPLGHLTCNLQHAKNGNFGVRTSSARPHSTATMCKCSVFLHVLACRWRPLPRRNPPLTESVGTGWRRCLHRWCFFRSPPRLEVSSIGKWVQFLFFLGCFGHENISGTFKIHQHLADFWAEVPGLSFQEFLLHALPMGLQGSFAGFDTSASTRELSWDHHSKVVTSK